ncbi:MAG: sugar-binding domain-containing protein [Bryobacteraceae bacterium]|jgi:beta-galactosidase
MQNENGMADSLSRRSLLGQAVGAAGVLSALGSTGRGDAQTPAQAPPAGGGRGGAGRGGGGLGGGGRKSTFDFGWKFFKGDAPGAQQPNFADGSWQDVDLPHDFSIEGPFDENAPAKGQGGYLPTGIGWYRKHFNIPESYSGRKVLIQFDGVYQLSEVWINGQYLGKRPNGYIGFSYDLSPHLKYGGENAIAVKADNSKQPNCRWYSGSGIYRHTWLLVMGQLHVAEWGTFVTTPKVEMDFAMVEIKVRVQNEGSSPVECRLTNTIMDRDGNVAEGAQVTEVKNIAANGEAEFVQQIRVDQPNLWSLESPYLYQVRTSVMGEGRGGGDSYDTTFGIRKVEFDLDRGFLLNGKHVRLNGFCLHHDGGSVGAAVPERVWERRLEIMKAAGFTSIRTSHNPYAPEFLDLCDKVGFLVMNEMFDEWKQNKTANGYGNYFDEWSERDLTAFVRRDRNHPSVLLWSLGNEIGEQAAVNGVEVLKRLADIIHKEDTTHFTTMGCDRIGANLTGREVGTPPEFLALLDVAGYNYFDRRAKRAETYCSDDRHDFPKRKFIGTENSSIGGVRGDYSGLVPTSGGPAPRRRNDRGTSAEMLWRFRRTYEYVTGDHMWTGIDHLGEAQWPSKGSGAGVIDTCGFPKDGYYFYQSQWTDKPMIHVFPHWNWKGKEGDVIPVLCYTNCDSVELFVNGKSFGEQGYWFPRVGYWPEQPGGRASAPRTTSDLHLTWTVPYQPGTLRAVGRKGGKVVLETEVSTTGEPAAIELSVDRDTIAADRRDVAHFTVKILDAQGRVVPTADNKVDFEIQGEGKIIGLDNGNLASNEEFKGKSRKAFNGLCLAIMQSTAMAGRIQLTATSPGLKSSSVAITTKA